MNEPKTASNQVVVQSLVNSLEPHQKGLSDLYSELQKFQKGQKDLDRELQKFREGQKDLDRELQKFREGQKDLYHELQKFREGQLVLSRELQNFGSELVSFRNDARDALWDARHSIQVAHRVSRIPRAVDDLFPTGSRFNERNSDRRPRGIFTE
jgi:predicted  nucleic acid-binding Zn-ribbon protein